MAAKNIKREQAKELYVLCEGKITNREIAHQLNEDEKKIAVWKQRDNWRDSVVQQKKKCCTTNSNTQKNKPKKRIEGKPNAVKHGLFSKWIPEETMEIVRETKALSPPEILWQNITMQYAAIIRAQRIMYVQNQQDMTKELSGESESDSLSSSSKSKSWDIQYSWDKQATFLQAQSRAMATLQSMIRQYDDLLRSELTTKEQQLRIEKLKAEIASSQGDDEGDGILKHMLKEMKEGLNNGD